MSPAELPALLYASTEESADVLYFARVEVPDAFIAFEANGKKIGVLSQLEYTRVKREGAFDEVLPLEEWVDQAKAANQAAGKGDTAPKIAQVVALVAQHYGQKAFRIAANFPAKLAFELREQGLTIEPVDHLFPARAFKTDAEAEGVRRGNAAAVAGYLAAEAVLRESTIAPDGNLYYDGAVLTSERLRFAIEVAALKVGAVALRTIVAGGVQACDPHHRGHGPLRANELLILDIFPRDLATGFYGDMTRTYLKGTPSPEQRRLVETVKTAQELALSCVEAGADPKKIHEVVVKFFEARGYKTEKRGDTNVGYFHGTGHGLGLDIHEPPRLSPRGPEKLREFEVVTIEPGLYYPEIGGCRWEDNVRVRQGGYELLSFHPYDWVIA